MAARSLAALELAFLTLTLPLAYVLNIWQDEAYSLHTTSSGMAYAVHEAIAFEAQAPLYFVVLDAWRALNGSVFFARSFSILCLLLTITVVWTIARRWLPRIPPFLPSLALAINPFAIWSALEIRLYAFALLLAALLVWTFLEGFVRGDSRQSARIYHTVLAIACLYTQYYMGALLAAEAVVILLQYRPRIGQYVLWFIPVVIATMPLAALVPHEMQALRGVPAAVSPLRAAGIVAESLDFILPHGWIDAWTHPVLLNVLYLATTATLAFMMARNAKHNPALTLFGPMAASIAAILFCAITVAHQQLVVPRQAVPLFIPALLMTFALMGTDSSRRRIVTAVFICVYSAFSVAAVARMYSTPVKPGDWRRVAEYVDARIKPHDTIAVFNQEIELPFLFYDKSGVPVVAIPRPENFETSFDQRKFAIRNRDEVAAVLASRPRSGARVWLLTTDQSPRAAAFSGRAILESYLRERYRTQSERRFEGTTVRELMPVDEARRGGGPIRKDF